MDRMPDPIRSACKAMFKKSSGRGNTRQVLKKTRVGSPLLKPDPAIPFDRFPAIDPVRKNHDPMPTEHEGILRYKKQNTLYAAHPITEHMPRSLFIGILLLVCLLAAAAGCTGQPAGRVVVTPAETIPVPDNNATAKTFIAISQAPLNETEKADILRLQEDQKYITDLNAILATQHPEITVFSNISRASAAYQASDNVILQRYGIASPEKAAAGEFSSGKLQAVTDNDINTGSNSVRDALLVSARAEELHIVDLESAIGRTDNPDLRFIYRQELVSARNNLRTLSEWITVYKTVFYPAYITVDYYKNLTSTPYEQVLQK